MIQAQSFDLCRRFSALAALAVAFSLVAGAEPASAQVDGAEMWEKGNCGACHGPLAEGGAGGEMPAGPSLRASALDRGQLIEAIGCGRPGTAMPFNLDGAFRQIACYGLPVGAPPEGMREGGKLKAPEVAALADFLLKSVKGQTTITKASCGAFFGGNPDFPLCATYR